MTPELRDACVKAVHVLTADGQVLRGGRASLYILNKLGYRSASLFELPPFVWGAELGYRIVANNRGFFSKYMFRHEPEFGPGPGPEKKAE